MPYDLSEGTCPLFDALEPLVRGTRRAIRMCSDDRNFLHTTALFSCSRWREIVKEEDKEEEQPSGLQIPGTLTLRHPGGFYFLQCAYGAVAIASTIISSCFFVGIVLVVPRWERDRGSSHQ